MNDFKYFSQHIVRYLGILYLNSHQKRNVEEIEAYKSEILSLQETVKILRSQNESLRQEISKKSPVSHAFIYLTGL